MFTNVSEGLAASIIALMIETARTSKTSVNFYHTTRRYNSEDSHLRAHRRENLRSYVDAHCTLNSISFALYSTQIVLINDSRNALEQTRFKLACQILRSTRSSEFSLTWRNGNTVYYTCYANSDLEMPVASTVLLKSQLTLFLEFSHLHSLTHSKDYF
jgi:hypothetical protein